jgi:hypothetical protein
MGSDAARPFSFSATPHPAPEKWSQILPRAEINHDPVLTEAEFAERVGLSIVTVRRQRKAGKIPYIQLSDHRIGYRQSQADKLLDGRTVNKAVQS